MTRIHADRVRGRPGKPGHPVGRTTIEVTSEPGRTLAADVWCAARVAEPRFGG